MNSLANMATPAKKAPFPPAPTKGKAPVGGGKKKC